MQIKECEKQEIIANIDRALLKIPSTDPLHVQVTKILGIAKKFDDRITVESIMAGEALALYLDLHSSGNDGASEKALQSLAVIRRRLMDWGERRDSALMSKADSLLNEALDGTVPPTFDSTREGRLASLPSHQERLPSISTIPDDPKSDRPSSEVLLGEDESGFQSVVTAFFKKNQETITNICAFLALLGFLYFNTFFLYPRFQAPYFVKFLKENLAKDYEISMHYYKGQKIDRAVPPPELFFNWGLNDFHGSRLFLGDRVKTDMVFSNGECNQLALKIQDMLHPKISVEINGMKMVKWAQPDLDVVCGKKDNAVKITFFRDPQSSPE